MEREAGNLQPWTTCTIEDCHLMPPFPDTLPPCSRRPHKLVSAHPTPTLFGRHYPSDRPPASRQTLFQLTIHSYTYTYTYSLFLSFSLSHTPPHTHALCQVREHCGEDSLWVVYGGDVYDVTGFLREHPGGMEALLGAAGQVRYS